MFCYLQLVTVKGSIKFQLLKERYQKSDKHLLRLLDHLSKVKVFQKTELLEQLLRLVDHLSKVKISQKTKLLEK